MDMDFTKVSFDANLDEIEDADELRGIVQKFESAQESNISEFQDAKDTLEDFEGRVGEAEEFKEDLAEDLSEVSPLSEDEALSYEMSRMRELIVEFSESTEEEAEADGGEGQFSNMGQKGETHNEDEAEATFAQDHLGDIKGLEI